MCRTDRDDPVAGRAAGHGAVEVPDLARAGEVEGGGRPGPEELETEGVGVSQGRPGGREGGAGAGGEGGGEGDEILVLDRFADVAQLGCRVPDGRTQRQGALGGPRPRRRSPPPCGPGAEGTPG